jgi:cellulose synthase (UDP-forming)
MKKTGLLVIVAVALLAVLYYFFMTPTQTPDSMTLSSTATIGDYASTYYGELSRPLYPDKSLGIPLLLQVFFSCVLIMGMLLLTMFFPKARHGVMLLTVLTSVRHLLWRGTETLDFSTPVSICITVVLYGAELIAFFAMVIGYFQIWEQKENPSIDISDISDESLPSVDVMICTYNEPVSVLYRSVVGSMSMDYPNMTVYLCDDGNRTEMRDLAYRLGVKYIGREKNTHAKAGNLNNAMKFSTGEFVLVFDADHVPCKNFLKETIGFFLDGEMGFIQTPQHFFTADPFQRNLLATRQINNEQDLFFHVIQPGNDHWGAAFFAGSGAIFRRTAIASAGGFAVETITEDVHTGMRIHGQGWKSLYYNKDLAAGMAQDSFVDVIKQRLRWARGMTQIFCLENPMFAKGLSFAQRICYFTGIWYFFHGLPRLAFLVAPLFFLLFGFKTINSGFIEVLIYYLPSFIATSIGYTIVSRGVRHSFWSEVYETTFCIYLSLTTFLTFLAPKNAKFRVTPKGNLIASVNFNWRIVLPQILITALTLFGIGMAITRGSQTPEYAGGIYANLIWSVYNLILLLGSIYVAQERPQFRQSPRIHRKIRSELKLVDNSVAVGYTTDISESGLSLVFQEPIPVTGNVVVKIMDWELNETSVLAVEVVRSNVDSKNQHHIAFRFVNRTEEQHRQLIKHMFGSSDVWVNDYVYTDTANSFAGLLSTPLRMLSAKETPLKRGAPRFNVSLPCALNVNGQMVQGSSKEVSESGLSLLLNSGDVPQGKQVHELKIQWPSGQITTLSARIIRNQNMAGLSLLSLQFVDVTAMQRIEIVQQIYRPKERLVRSAPSVQRNLSCLMTPLDEAGNLLNPLQGRTQEISELGAIIYLTGEARLGIRQRTWVEWTWEDGQNARFPAVIEHVSQQHGSVVALVYFEGLTLKALDDISLHLHTQGPERAFKTLIGE